MRIVSLGNMKSLLSLYQLRKTYMTIIVQELPYETNSPSKQYHEEDSFPSSLM